jgi:hypothetical protein
MRLSNMTQHYTKYLVPGYVSFVKYVTIYLFLGMRSSASF